MFFFSLYIIAVAQGLHKPCVQAFGADQFDELHPDECRAKSSFFNWWAFGNSVAIIITLLVLTYVQDYVNWGLGFGIPCLLMVFALVFFLIGTRTYRFRIDVNHGEGFNRIRCVFVEAARNWRPSSSSVSSTNEQSPQFKFLNKALVETDGSNEDKKVCCIKEVEEAKAVLKLFPIWLSCLVYGILYSQPATLFTKQGLTMSRSISSRFEVPAASLQCIINATMIVFIPAYDRILVPFTRSITKRPTGLTMLQRIGIGIFLSVLSMSIAAVIEKKRLETAKAFGLVDKPGMIVPMSVAWLIPQYLLFGMSESFAFVGLQEFFYDQVPNELKSTGVALYLSVMGVGGFLSSILISVIEKVTNSGGGNDEDGWFCDNLNKAHLDYFYWLLAGLAAFSLAVFVCFAKSYVYSRKQLLKLPDSTTSDQV
ncbi:OLC1v1015745C1 [Oldenlandia corymbosa var. corymbosa]|nr:OLC1v1015745C1 [Oldenlandia corymbosa var. corymbosa]